MMNDIIKGVTSWTSSKPTRIHLPCTLTDELTHEAFDLFCKSIDPNVCEDFDRWTHLLSESNVSTYLSLRPCQSNPTVCYRIEIVMPDGKISYGHKLITLPTWQAVDIITAFLSDGAPGLRSDYAAHYTKIHGCYIRNCLAKDGQELNPKYHDIYTSFADLTSKGYLPQQVITLIDQ